MTVSSDYEKILVLMSALYKSESTGLCEVYWNPDTPSSPTSKDAMQFNKQVHNRHINHG